PTDLQGNIWRHTFGIPVFIGTIAPNATSTQQQIQKCQIFPTYRKRFQYYCYIYNKNYNLR
ncbi:MAG: hypothetical protein KKD86_02815, partial [Bacteroidetes bacterium]|nr:hypothetical protein [Bacteroidota bacterium]